MLFNNNFDVFFSHVLSCIVSLKSIDSVLFTSYCNCSIERKFSYLCDRASLTHNVLRRYVVWKHKYPHGMFFYKTGKQTIIGRAT
jgi:hypothetical protein